MRRFEGRTGGLMWETSGAPTKGDLILVHSLGTDSRMWADQIPVFEERRRVLRFDLPGHGSSSAAPGEYTIESLGLDVADLATEAGMPTFDICGISLGGVVSLWIAANMGDRVESLVACNTAPKIGTGEGWSDRIDRVSSQGMDGIRDEVVARFITSNLAKRRPETYDLVYAMFDGIDPVGYTGCCAALRDADLWSTVPGIRSPTLLVGGTEDISTPPDAMEILHEAIPGSTLTIIDEAAHLSNIDQPERFNQAVGRFLT